MMHTRLIQLEWELNKFHFTPIRKMTVKELNDWLRGYRRGELWATMLAIEWRQEWDRIHP